MPWGVGVVKRRGGGGVRGIRRLHHTRRRWCVHVRCGRCCHIGAAEISDDRSYDRAPWKMAAEISQ